MSLIDIRMDNTSFSIDGYEVGARQSSKYRVCPISTWDKVREVLDGFDIDQPARDAEEIASLKSTLKVLEEENINLHMVIRREGSDTGETAV